MHFAVRSIVLAITVAVVCSCANRTTQVQTVAGPEASDLSSNVKGCVVYATPRGGLRAVDVRSLVEHIVRADARPDVIPIATVHAVSGPDRGGRVAYIEDHFVAEESERTHLLKTIEVDGSNDTAVFIRAGSAMWATTAAGNGEIGSHLALSHEGGRVAFVSGLTAQQMPGALLYRGALEVWDVNAKRRIAVTADALNAPMAWSPDSKWLYYVALTPRSALPDQVRLSGFGYVDGWSQLPAVHRLDLDTGESSFVHMGWSVVASDSTGVCLVGNWSDDYRMVWSRVDPDTGKAERVTWPGDSGGAIGLLKGDLVVYRGLPTEGMPASLTASNSPLSGPKAMQTIKLAQLGSGRFQTVVLAIDPRLPASFGVADDAP